MPTINKLPPKPKSTFHNDTPMRELRQKAYNTKEWKALRLSFLIQHPLCAECLKEGKVTPADQVHHRASPFAKGQINYALLLDENNLESICAYHHAMEHQKERGYTSPEEIIKALDEFFEDVPDE